MGLLEQIKDRTGDERTAVTILQEIARDRRTDRIRTEREGRSNGKNGDPATDRQKSFLKRLGVEFAGDITKKNRLRS